MRVTKWQVLCAAALVGSGVAFVSSGVLTRAEAAVGDCTSSPPTTTSSTASTSTTTTLVGSPAEPETVIVTGAGQGGGPHVQIFADAETVIGSFYAYAPSFTGGVNVAAGDVNGDGYDDIVTGAGPGGGPHVRIFGGATVLGASPTLSILGEFMAYDPGFTGGVSVAGADMGGGDSTAEIVVGAGLGGGPHVRVLEPTGAAMEGTGGGFMAFGTTFHGGVNVAADCTDGVARIAVSTKYGDSGWNDYRPDGLGLNHGAFYRPTHPYAQPGLGIAIGPLVPDESPGVQVITGLAEAGDSPQVVIWGLTAENDPIDGFNAYAATVRISVALGSM